VWHAQESIEDISEEQLERTFRANIFVLGLRDDELAEPCACALAEAHTQLSWLLTRMKAAAPQALLVAA
jgi:hypothetical protein